MKIVLVVGARPNFMKAAPIIHALEAHNLRLAPVGENRRSQDYMQFVLVHTGQHYDKSMSDTFFADLNLPAPSVHLGVGSGSHAVQTAEIMKQFESVLLKQEPDAVVVVGDVNSTLACALVTSKISFGSEQRRPLIAHVEAGLRSSDRSMPEEVNRILVDQISDLLFVTEESGVRNLRQEGIAADKIHFVGNTMIDSLLKYKDKAETSDILDRLSIRSQSARNGSANGAVRYALLTLHRASNVDHRETFLNILQGIEEVADRCPVIFPVHPRTRNRIAEFGLERYFVSQTEIHGWNESLRTRALPGIHLTEPLGYLDFLCLMKHASLVITDSGGIQEETTCLGIPCVTVRENTERPVTVNCGTNCIAGTTREGIRSAIREQFASLGTRRGIPEKWDGRSGDRILEVLYLQGRSKRPLDPENRIDPCLPGRALYPIRTAEPAGGPPTAGSGA